MNLFLITFTNKFFKISIMNFILISLTFTHHFIIFKALTTRNSYLLAL